jgi:subtilisin family serine protease
MRFALLLWAATRVVVALAAPRANETRALERERFVARVEALGARVIASLGDGASDRPAPGARPRRDAAPNPFDLDPSRVLLIDAGSYENARDVTAALAGDAQVAWAEPERERVACTFPADGSPNDPLFLDTRQWGLWNAGAGGVYAGLAGADIGAREAWRLSCGSNAVLLGVADTGIDPTHPDLIRLLPDGRPRLALAHNVTSEASASFADSNGHGTVVAGVMAALTHDGAHFDSLGVAGVCGGDGTGNAGCRLAIFKIAAGHSSSASSFDIARAIVMAADAGVRALNLSFAGDAESRVERRALYYALTRGCVVVAAIGNRGVTAPTAPQYPAAFAAEGLCLGVGASDARDRRAAFSSYGPGLDVLAPGLEIWSASLTYVNAFGAPAKGYLAASGTSLAAPFVTGTIGLMAAREPRLADVDAQQLLRASARDLGAAGPDSETGWGRLDAAAALRAIGPGVGVWHEERAAIAQPGGVAGTLTVATDSFGTFDRGAWWANHPAERIEVRLTFTLPDSFDDSARVWPRVGGTMALRGDFQLSHYAPWAEVSRRDGREITLRGYLYRVLDAPDSVEAWLPLPPDQARIGFTVLGRVRASPRAGVAGGAPRPPALRAAPNPMRGAARFTGPPGERFTLTDLAGRVVLRGALDPRDGAFAWDGRGEDGRRMRAGLYFLSGNGRIAAATATRVVLLE